MRKQTAGIFLGALVGGIVSFYAAMVAGSIVELRREVERMNAALPDLALEVQGLRAAVLELTGPIGSEVVASHYGEGDGFHGRPTASGTVFNKLGMSAAHRTLPLGSLALVRYAPTGRVAVLPITDRGPFIKDEAGRFSRDLDLSFGAARRLGMDEAGVDKVEMKIIRKGKGK